MKSVTRKITTAAVCTALAVIMCVLTAYLPLSFMPLFLAAFCIFVACKRAGLPYGILCAAASVGLMFLMTGLSVKWLVFVLMFAPYGVVAYLLHPFTYYKVKSALIRGGIMLVYFNVMFGAVYAVTANVMSVGLDGINILQWSAKVGGYAVLAVIATLVLLPLDVILTGMAAIVLKRLPPIGVTRLDKSSGDRRVPPASADGQTHYDDVFGYEIIEGKDADDDKPEDKPEDKS